MDSVLMDKEEWKRTHRDFKKIIGGQRFVMASRGALGTCLVPVEIVDKKTYGDKDE